MSTRTDEAGLKWKEFHDYFEGTTDYRLGISEKFYIKIGPTLHDVYGNFPQHWQMHFGGELIDLKSNSFEEAAVEAKTIVKDLMSSL